MLIETWRQVCRFKAIAVAAVILSATPVVPITLTGNYNTSGEARGVAVSGKYAYVADNDDGLDIIGEFRPAPKVTSSTEDVLAASPIVIPFGGEPLAVLLMLGCGSYALKNRGRHLSNLPKNSEPNS